MSGMMKGRMRFPLNGGGQTDISAATRYYPPLNGSETDSSGKTIEGGMRTLAIQATITDATVTVEATLEDSKDIGDGTTSSTPNWVDVTKTGKKLSTGATGSASLTASDILLFEGIPIKAYRVKVVTADATNAIRLTAIEGD